MNSSLGVVHNPSSREDRVESTQSDKQFLNRNSPSFNDKQASSIRAFDSVDPALEHDIPVVGFRRFAGIIRVRHDGHG